jgi:large subunit ribosomal protein L10
VQKEDKEKIVTELTEKLRSSETMIVADYRGLTMTQIDALRTRLIENGARFTVVKNTLTRRAAEAAGADALLALLEGPSAIAFVEADGDAVAVAKALADSVRDTKVLEIKGGVMQGRVITGAEVDALAKLPPFDVLRSQVIGAVIAPLNAIAGLINAPLQNLYGLLEARIDQLQAEGDTSAAEPAAEQVSDTEAVSDTTEEPAAAEEATEENQEEETDGGS